MKNRRPSLDGAASQNTTCISSTPFTGTIGHTSGLSLSGNIAKIIAVIKDLKTGNPQRKWLPCIQRYAPARNAAAPALGRGAHSKCPRRSGINSESNGPTSARAHSPRIPTNNRAGQCILLLSTG